MLDSPFPQPLSGSFLVFFLVWGPLLHILYIYSPNHYLLFTTHAHTIATCFAVVQISCHLFLISLSVHKLEICLCVNTISHTSQCSIHVYQTFYETSISAGPCRAWAKTSWRVGTAPWSIILTIHLSNSTDHIRKKEGTSKQMTDGHQTNALGLPLNAASITTVIILNVDCRITANSVLTAIFRSASSPSVFFLHLLW